MFKVLMASVLVLGAPAASSSSCDTKTPAPPDKVIARRTPQESTKHCWELRVARRGKDNAVDLLCVDPKVWESHPVGSKYP